MFQSYSARVRTAGRLEAMVTDSSICPWAYELCEARSTLIAIGIKTYVF